MESISKMALGQESYYINDYYQNGEEPGVWMGEGAKRLGLVGSVEGNALSSLWQGMSPDGDRPLVRSTERASSAKRVPGWDVTLSAPKSISVLWSQSDPRTRRDIESAIAASAKVVVDYYQSQVLLARRGANGIRRELADLVVAGFPHQTSRRNDPQLHWHLLFCNVCVRTSDGSTGTIESRELYRHKMAAGALFRTQLAFELRKSLGVAIREGVAGTFEVAGVPNSVMSALSNRRKEIKAALNELGFTSARASEMAALQTRPQKQKKLSRDELFASWRLIGEKHEFGPVEASRLIRAGVEPSQAMLSPTLVGKRTVADLTRTQGHFADRDVVKVLAVNGQTRGWTAETVLAAKDIALSHRLIQRVGERITTKSHLNLEKKLLVTSDRLAAVTRHQISDEVRRDVLRKASALSDEQRQAFDYLTGKPGAVKTVRGLPGTGKTQMLKAAHTAWKRSGLRVLGVTLSGKAAAELERGSKIKSDTFETFFARLDRGRLYDKTAHVVDQFARAAKGQRTFNSDALRLTPRTVVVVDEAAMATTRQLARLLKQIEGSGAMVAMVGDDRQLQSVESGGGFSSLHRRVGGAELNDIRRQKHEWMRKAVIMAAEGNARGALAIYGAKRKLTLGDTHERARRLLVIDWKRHRTKDLSASIIIASKNTDVRKLNRMAQSLRKKRRELGSLAKQRIGGGWVYRGDRILVTANSRKLGIRNGELASIERIGLDTITLKMDDRSQKWGVAITRHVTIPKESYRALELGYAISAHKSQGATFEKSFVFLGTDFQNRELSLVQLSRATDDTRLYAGKREAGEDLTEMVQAMSRSHKKTLALEQEQQTDNRIRM